MGPELREQVWSKEINLGVTSDTVTVSEATREDEIAHTRI